MIIVSKVFTEQQNVIGRMSDGSDRQVTTVTIYTIKVDDGAGLRELTFDHDPTDTEIHAKLAEGGYQDITDDIYRLRQRIELAEQALNDLILGGGA